jgi:hypothetical protein
MARAFLSEPFVPGLSLAGTPELTGRLDRVGLAASSDPLAAGRSLWLPVVRLLRVDTAVERALMQIVNLPA